MLRIVDYFFKILSVKLPQSFKKLTQSKYLFSIAFMVMAFGLVNNLGEQLLKDLLKTSLKGQENADHLYKAFWNDTVIWIGVLSTLSALFVSGNVVRFLGWNIAAYITPIIYLTCTSTFFVAVYFKNFFNKSWIT